MNTERTRRTLKLTCFVLASITGWACGSESTTDCAQTATCGPMGVDAGDAASSLDSSSEAADVSSDQSSDGGNVTQDVSSESSNADASASTEAGDAGAIKADAGDGDAGTARADAGDATAGDAMGQDAALPECTSNVACDPGMICNLVTQKCVQGCAPDHACAAGMTCCAGQCYDTKKDILHCGSCTNACNLAYATAECKDSVCKISGCSSGHFDCDGKTETGCETATPAGPSVPLLWRPYSGFATGSVHAPAESSVLRPTFTWHASTQDTCGAVTYQIQFDDSCTPGQIQSCAFNGPHVKNATISTTSYQPAANMLDVKTTVPVGTRYYWRVQACDAANICSAWSPVRYVDVGRLRDDLNGDGYSDILVRSATDKLYVYWGGSTPMSAVGPQGFPGDAFAFAGDLDGDGFADLVVGDQGITGGTGSYGGLRLYRGKATWDTSLGDSQQINHQPNGVSGFPSDVAGAGDLDGDGFGEVIGADGPHSVAIVYSGGLRVGAAIGSVSLRTVIATNSWSALPNGLSRVGDVNGDGLQDIGMILTGPTNAGIGVYLGAAPFAASDPKFIDAATSANMQLDLRTLRGAGDLDGDGFDDIAVAAIGVDSHYSTLVTMHGRATFPDQVPAYPRQYADDILSYTGLAGGSDSNNDGYIYWSAVDGNVLQFIPGAIGFNAENPAAQFINGIGSIGLRYGSSLATGDYDGDGKADVAIAASTWSQGNPSEGAVGVRLAKGGTPIMLTPPNSAVGFGAALGH